MILYEDSNLLSKSHLRYIQEGFTSNNVDWRYTDFSAYDVSERNSLCDYSFSTNVYDSFSNSMEKTFDILYPTFLIAMERMGIDTAELIRIRVGMITNVNAEYIHDAHVDYTFDHKTMILYLNDSDGYTYLYNEKYTPGDKVVKDPSELTLATKVSPEANKFFIFDGLHYHSSSCPIKHKRRLVVNYNFK